jgi:hypothetical protein
MDIGSMSLRMDAYGVVLIPADESEGELGFVDAEREGGDGHGLSEIKCVFPPKRSSSAGVKVVKFEE